MKLKILFILFFIQHAFFYNSAIAQDGSLDNTFDLDGQLSSIIGTFDDAAYGIALKEDSLDQTNFTARKIIIAGQTFNGSNYDFLVIQYNHDGSLDNSFGINGIVTLSLGNYDDKARAIAIQSDGKIVVAGYSFDGNKDNFALVRLNVDGTIDNSFNGNGYVITSIGTTADNINSIAMQSDGSIFAGGFTQSGTNMDFAVAKYTTTGMLDNSFDADGIKITPIGSSTEYISKILLQPDGKIIAVGSSLQTNDYDFAIVRYNSDGTYDNTFNSNGFVLTFILGNFNEYANSACLQSDGKILIAGMSNNSFSDFIVVRYNNDGTVDSNFGGNGIAITDFGTAADYGQAADITLQSDNKIIVGGLRTFGAQLDFALARYDQNGILDVSFDVDGLVNTTFGNGDDQIRATIMQNDGKIIVAGSSHDGTQNKVALARYNNPSISTTTALAKNGLNNIQALPNPFNSSCTIIAQEELKNARLNLYNNQGDLCFTQNNLNGKLITLQRNNLAAGIYFVKIINYQQNVMIQKLVIGD